MRGAKPALSGGPSTAATGLQDFRQWPARLRPRSLHRFHLRRVAQLTQKGSTGVRLHKIDRTDECRHRALSRRPGCCSSCGRPVGNRMNRISYSGYRFPPEIIQQAIWLYLRFTLSLRDVEDLLAERGITVSYESIRRWLPLRADDRSGLT
jgi:hypothetical protein